MKIITYLCFRYHRHYWLKETKFSSNPDQIIANGHYQKIIGLGAGIVSYLINDLKTKHYHWFAALEMITGHKMELSYKDTGDTACLCKYWINWYEGT